MAIIAKEAEMSVAVLGAGYPGRLALDATSQAELLCSRSSDVGEFLGFKISLP